jgi:hypothetical protein
MKWFRPVAVVLASAAALALAPAFAADDPAVIPLEIVVGQVTVISSGPVNRLICDDPGLVQPVFTDAGPGLKGLSTGTTTCSLTDTLSMRRVYRVVVVANPATRPSGPQGAGKAGSGG